MIKRIIIAVAILTMLAAHLAWASTWYVRKDGCGDFTVIQDAVDAAVSGDVIWIGPGRYEETTIVDGPGWHPYTVCIYAPGKDLHLYGMGATATIIDAGGSDEYNSCCVLADYEAQDLIIHDVTFTGAYDALCQYDGYLKCVDCTFMSLLRSLSLRGGRFKLQECSFEENLYNPYFLNMTEVRIKECDFSGSGSGISIRHADRVVLADCNFDHAGVILDDIADLSVRNCNLNTQGTGLRIYDSSGTVQNCEIRSDYSAVRLIRSDVSFENSIIRSTSRNALDIERGGQVAAHSSHFLAEEYAVRVSYFNSLPDVFFDFTGNYWGEMDSGAIADKIFDGQDDPGIRGFVIYEPFAGQPLPTQSMSWGEVKTIYGDR